MQIYFDGGCQPNPGERELLVIVDGEVIHEPHLGHGTNNEAEWLAVLFGISVAKSKGAKSVELVGDSLLVVNQANGVWRCKAPSLLPFLADFEQERRSFQKLTLRHVRRDDNPAGVALENIQKGSYE